MVFTATAGYLDAFEIAIATFIVVSALFYVAFDRIVFHTNLLYLNYVLFGVFYSILLTIIRGYNKISLIEIKRSNYESRFIKRR